MDTASDRWHAWCTDPRYVAHHRCTGPKSGPRQKSADDKRQELFETFRLYVQMLPADALLAVEEPLALAKNGKTTRLLGLSAGALWAAHIGCPVFWLWVDIAAWKKEIVGNGGADKDTIREWCMMQVPGMWKPEDGDHGPHDSEPDYYDAAAIAHYGEWWANRAVSSGDQV